MLQLKQFGHKKNAELKRQHTCAKCGKSFDTEDYLEFHAKTRHNRGDKVQDRYRDYGAICPAELCDIFECPEMSYKEGRYQVYTMRSDGSYEYKQD